MPICFLWHPLMKHSWPTDEPLIAVRPENFRFASWIWPFCDPRIWPREKQKKRTLMNRSWSTHEPLIKGALWIQIHSCIHTFLMNKAFCGILGTPEDSFGPLRISRWTSWRIPDPWLSWRIWLSLTSLRRLTNVDSLECHGFLNIAIDPYGCLDELPKAIFGDP